MSKAKSDRPSLATAQEKLAALGFELQSLNDGKVLARKLGCAAVLAAASDGSIEFAAPPGLVVDGELALLIDRGYQKFFKTADTQRPAWPEQIRDLARFENELRFACGIPVLYNQSLGSVSDRYLYDRIWYRDQGRQPKAWEADAAAALRA